MSQKFLNSIKSHAINASKNSGMLASVIAAQAALETGYGTSELAKNANNLFGIKGSYNGQSYTKRTAEHKPNGQVYYVNAAFRKYPSYTESFKDRIAFFTSTPWRTKTYKPVTDAKSKGYKAQVKALHESPYATDVNYDDKLLKIIEQYKLYEWDGVKVTKRHLIVSGHGGNDPGAIGNGTNERDFTRNHIVDKVVKYINQIDGHKAEVYNKKNNMYVDTQYGSGYGMYWAKSQGYDSVTEYHLDAASASARGGHVIVYSGFVPDKADLGIRDALQKFVGIRYNHKGHAGVSGRNNLLQVNVAANIGMPYRLVELGFITNKADFQAINRNIDALCKAMAEAIAGGKVTAQKPKKPANTDNSTTKKDEKAKTPRTIGSWQVNKQNGAQYIKAEGTFTVTAEDGIIARFHNPSTSAKHGGVAKKGWSTKYAYLVRAGDLVWIQYQVDGKGPWKFLPFNDWDSKTGAVGKTPWGVFS